MRYKLDEASLRAILVEMPTTSHEWEVERVLQYRCVYGEEQWLIKWKGFTEDRNTWEPWCVLPLLLTLLSAHLHADKVRWCILLT